MVTRNNITDEIHDELIIRILRMIEQKDEMFVCMADDIINSLILNDYILIDLENETIEGTSLTEKSNDLLQELKNKKQNISREYIKLVVETETNINDLSIVSRKRDIVEARSVYFKLCKDFLPLKLDSLSVIGEGVNLHHATVIHGLKLFENLYNQESFASSKDTYLKSTKTIKHFIKQKTLDVKLNHLNKIL